MKLTIDTNMQKHEFATKKAVEEFVLIAEISTEWIEGYLELKEINEEANSYLSEKIKWRLEEYYQNHRTTFYKEEEVFFNGEIRVDLEVVSKLYDQTFYDETSDSDMTDDKDGQYAKYLRKEFGTDLLHEIDFLKLADCSRSCYLLLLQDENFLNALLVPANNKFKYLRDKELYIERLTMNVIDKLDNMNLLFSKYSNKINSEIKYWREIILKKSRELLSEIIKEDKDKHVQYVRVLILKSLIEAAGINPRDEISMQYFIGNVLGFDYETVKEYYKKLEAEHFGLKKPKPEDSSIAENEKTKPEELKAKERRLDRQLKEILETCNLLMSKENSKGNLLIEEMKNRISKAGTPEYKNIK